MYKKGRRVTVLKTNCFFRHPYTYFDYTIYDPSVISEDMHMQTNIPSEGIIKINKNALKFSSFFMSTIEFDPITRAAHDAYANEPNKSAPIPATSPTLSPTLSAIVAGFLGLS